MKEGYNSTPKVVKNKITLLDVIDNQMEFFMWGFIVFIISITTLVLSGNITEMSKTESNNTVILKLIDDGYPPIVAGCAVNTLTTACIIVATKVDLNKTKEIK